MNILPIEGSHPCRDCGYDLRGLDANGVCPECGSAISQTIPRCPRCPTLFDIWIPLNRVDRSDYRVWECGRCGGLGFDRGVLAAAIPLEPRARTNESLHEPSLQAPARCGRCLLGMDQLVIDQNTLIDRCAACGFVWIDFGELSSVVAKARRELSGRPVPPLIDQWLDKPDKLAEWRRQADEASDRTSLIEVVVRAIFRV
ncbi:MAG: hypothetical protein ACOYN0_11770 [Phycisphaerales bacterium]